MTPGKSGDNKGEARVGGENEILGIAEARRFDNRPRGGETDVA